MSKLRDRMQNTMELRGYSPSTIKSYIDCVARYSRHYNKSPKDLKNEDIRSYLTYLLKEKTISTSAMNQAYSSLKIIYTMTTHLLEDGTDIFTIKELLGHSSIKTTTIYLHISNKHIKSIKDPLNFLNRED